MEVTLDTCAVIALANDEPDAKYLKTLRDEYHRQELITLSVGRTIYFEAMPKDTTEPTHVISEKRIADAGLNIDRVQLYRSGQPIAFHCRECNAITYAPEYDQGYAQCIRDILTGNKKIDSRYYQYRQRRINDPEEKVKRVWHNHFNDVCGLVDHIAWGGDIFVTSDPDFLNKTDKLAAVVPGKILSPKATLDYLSNMSIPLPKPPAWQPRVAIQQCIGCRLKHLVAS